MSVQLWGGRFGTNAGKTNSILKVLNNSLPIDSRLFAEDIDASKAYAQALKQAHYINTMDCEKIVKGLELIRYEWIEHKIKFLNTDEDVHTVNERRLIEIIGEIGQRLHTGRSRNDQVITDLKLWIRKAVSEVIETIAKLLAAIISQAEMNLDVLMPGYTHMQRAQPVYFSHWLCAHAFALHGDCERLLEYRERMNILPLGSGALAGNPLGIDRKWLAKRLKFKGITSNSMHTVGDRDFVGNLSIMSVHLSRFAEDLVIFSTKEFDFISIADEFSTGSSLMPQKRNPDSLELVRGISGKISASFVGIMMTLKGTPTTYNKDFQFDKQYCFDAFDNMQLALAVMEGVISTLTVKRANMEAALSPDLLATDWAYYLVRKDVAFRTAHEYIGQVVLLAEKLGKDITDIPLEDLQNICAKFDTDIVKVCNYHANAEHYNEGGTSLLSIQAQLMELKNYISQLKH